MTTSSAEAELLHAERRLQAAQRTSDVAALADLLDERLLLTAPSSVDLLTRADDLDVHASGRQSVTRVDELDVRVLVTGTTGVTWVLVELAGTFDGVPFGGRFRYTRTWTREDGAWRAIAVHASPV